MKKSIAVVAAFAALGAAGCTKGAQVQSSAATQRNEAAAQAVVQKCAAKSNFITKPGRKAFIACIAPPGEETKVQACASKALAKDGVLTKAARKRFEGDLSVCILPSTPTHTGTKK